MLPDFKVSCFLFKEMTNESEIEKNQLIKRIENLNAFYLFCKQNFKEAMDLFLKLETGIILHLLIYFLKCSLVYRFSTLFLHDYNVNKS